MVFPKERPDSPACASILWKLQLLLMDYAEAILGPREAGKKLYQPVFSPTGPYVINTPNFDGGFAALSPNAAGFWPTAVYEMAHETVHLLNPRVLGTASYFEEGIAVSFSVAMILAIAGRAHKPTGRYAEAFAMVERLQPATYEVAKRVRQQFGTLSSATGVELKILLPDVDDAFLEKLASKFSPSSTEATAN